MSIQPLRIALRADASAQIGLGHVKRSLSLATALRSLGADVRLVTRDLGVDVAPLASAAGIGMSVLPRPTRSWSVDSGTAYRHWAGVSWEDDARDSVAASGSDGSDRTGLDWMIVDHYAFDAHWHRQVARALECKVAVIDDLADRALAAEVVIDHNCAADHRQKYAAVVTPGTRILGGPRFALLAAAYVNVLPHTFSSDVRSIGIFMGGLDAPNWSAVALRACREQAGFEGRIEIVTTSANPNLHVLQRLVQLWPMTQLRTDLPDLVDFFRSHDLQIGAGGGATWERCRVGAPTLAIAYAHNQAAVVTELAAAGVVETVSELSDVAIGAAVRQLIDSPQMRRNLSERARALVDGRGALRVASALCADTLTLRDADGADARLMYEWRNHPLTRSVSGNSAAIAWEAHLEWMKKVLSDPDRMLQIGTIGNLPVGVIRHDGIGGAEAEVSLYLDPGLHGLGLGGALLRAGEACLKERSRTVRRNVATVLEGNLASRRMFDAAGYIQRDPRTLVKDLNV